MIVLSFLVFKSSLLLCNFFLRLSPCSSSSCSLMSAEKDACVCGLCTPRFRTRFWINVKFCIACFIFWGLLFGLVFVIVSISSDFCFTPFHGSLPDLQYFALTHGFYLYLLPFLVLYLYFYLDKHEVSSLTVAHVLSLLCLIVFFCRL